MSGPVRNIFLGSCLVCLMGSLAAQTPKPPAPAANPAAAQPQTQSQPQTPTEAPPEAQAGTPADAYRLSVQVKRVILDVVVTDAKGKPVEGLKQDDFKVLENGVPQPVRSFDEHRAAAPGATQPPIDLHLPPNTFSNLTLAPSDKPVTILLYDMLNTPQTALPYAHQALVKFIKDQKSSTRIAIFALTDQLHMLQGFTAEETRLMAAIDSKSLKSHISTLRTSDTGADAASLLAADPASAAATAAQQSQPTAADSSTTGADSVLAQLSNAEAQETSYLLQQRLQITVDAFTDIARFVSLLPGRKNLIWMSGSFPMQIFPDSTQPSGSPNAFSNAVYLDENVRIAQEELKDSRVAVYPVDVRGLQADPQFSAATRYAAGPPKSSTFGIEQGAEHATMDAIADATGGHAFYNTNGLQEAMESAVRQGSEYYSLTYAPSDTRADGRSRGIKVLLKEPGYQLSYRKRYLSEDASHPVEFKPLALDMNMQHGAPNSSELFFEARVVPVGTVIPATTAEMEGLQRFLQTDAKGKRVKISDAPEKIQHYDINLAIIGRQLQMPQADNGKYATAMRFGLAAYTQDGELLNGTEVSIKNALPASQYQKIQTDGYHASMLFAVPSDAATLRIAVRDEIGNRIGTVEIPVPVPVH